MPLPSFTVTGNLFDLLGNLDGSDELVGNGLGAGMPASVTFSSNVPINQFVTYAGDLFRVDPVVALVKSDGTLHREGLPVKLLANDAGLNVEGLQWRVDGAGMATFVFDAPVDGETVDLSDVVPVPGIPIAALDVAAQIAAALNAVKGTASAAMDTLGEIEDALNDDPDFAATMTTLLAGKLGTAESSMFPVGRYGSLQAALDACAAAGGGTVMLPMGPTYVPSGGVHLPSRVTLAGPHVRHANAQFAYVDGSGFYRPGNINTTTGLAAFDGAYLVPAAGSTGPMIWAGTYDTAYAVRDLTIFGVDVFGQNISPGAIPSWTNSFAWIETAGTRTNSSTTLTCSVVQVMPQMVGRTVTGTGIPAATTVVSVNVGANTMVISAAATSTATGTAAFTVAGGLAAPPTPISGRQAISFGSGCAATTNRTRSLLENVYTWGCGSGGPGTTANNRTWSETNATTVNGSNGVTLSSQTVSPLMIGAPVTGTGIPGGAVVSTINPTTNRIFLSANATASGTGVALTIGGSGYTGDLQQVYVGTPGIYIGCREVVMRGVICYMGGGDGWVIDSGDGQIDGDNMTGFNSGWGLRTTINGGPTRAVGAIDSFQNGIYGGAGNALIEGAGHVFMDLHCNTAGQENLKFGRCINTAIYYLNATDAGLRFSTDATRYNSVQYAAPAASSSNPAWNIATNSGVVIFGGSATTVCGFENHIFADTSVSLPNVFGMAATGTVWNNGSPNSSAFGLVDAFTSGWRFIGGSFPDKLTNGFGLPAFLRSSISTTDALQVLAASGGATVAGFGPGGAFYQGINAQTLASNGAVTIDASKGNVQAITLQANATSSSITNAKDGQVMAIQWIQDATGGRTYVWPSNCVFSGGMTPFVNVTASTKATVSFYYDGTNWVELCRSVNTTPLARLVAPAAYVSGQYYYCNSPTFNGTSVTLGNGTARVSPWLVTTPVTLSKLFADFSVAGEANSKLRLGIWNDDGTGKPGTLLLDAGSISTGSGNAGDVATGGTPGVYEISVSQLVPPGLYWPGAVVQGAATTQPTVRTVSIGLSAGGPLGTSLPVAGGLLAGYSWTHGQGTLSAASSPAATSSAARLGFKVS